MKQRLKIDGVILIVLAAATLVLYFFPALFAGQMLFDGPLFFLGVLLIMKGMFIRMSARGHKKALSPKGWGLAKSGLYAYTRNPMYLGSFLSGLGFAMILWPWWALPVFATLFYVRFSPTVRLEESNLKGIFGKEYENYCRDVPQFFPSIPKLMRINKRTECPWEELWTTKEQHGFWYLPVAALLAKFISDGLLYRFVDWPRELMIFAAAVVVFWAHMLYEYKFKYGKDTK